MLENLFRKVLDHSQKIAATSQSHLDTVFTPSSGHLGLQSKTTTGNKAVLCLFDSFAPAQGLEADLRDKYDESISYNDVMSAAMYPKVFDEYRRVPLQLHEPSREDSALPDGPRM